MNSPFSAWLAATSSASSSRSFRFRISLAPAASGTPSPHMLKIVAKSFKSPWRLKHLIGKPASGSFRRDNTLAKFAISHRISRGDSVASLAVKYSVQVMDIERLNNLMSEHGIYRRERLLIPISNAEMLVGATCYVEVDPCAKREVAVLYWGDGPDRKSGDSSTLLEKNDADISGANSEQCKKRVLESLRRNMQVDDATALYYLSIADGDPRAALSQFSQDLRWETHSAFPNFVDGSRVLHCINE